MGYFLNTYIQCRTQFRSLSQRVGLTSHPLKLTGTDNDLTIDYCYHPIAEADTLVVLSSGLHGIEGYAGSALQCYLLAEKLAMFKKFKSSLLLLHGLNPYGFKYMRRTDELNVDLNRNFGHSNSLYKTENKLYTELNTFLNPRGQVTAGDLDASAFAQHLQPLLEKHQTDQIGQAIVKGQYKHRRGIYFGGTRPAQQKKLIDNFLPPILSQYKKILAIDIHTGYGRRGQLHLFPEAKTEKTKRLIEQTFQGQTIDWGGSEGFYRVTGEFVNYLTSLVGRRQLLVPMIFEYGTLDSHTQQGAVLSLHTMILENQGHFSGYSSSRTRAAVKKRFIEMYYPSEPSWRSGVLSQGERSLRRALKNFASL